MSLLETSSLFNVELWAVALVKDAGVQRDGSYTLTARRQIQLNSYSTEQQKKLCGPNLATCLPVKQAV